MVLQAKLPEGFSANVNSVEASRLVFSLKAD